MGVKMDRTGIIVCSVVGSLGVLSAIFGFSAEGTKLTPYTILVLDDECIYPANPALALAVCATIFLLLAQITVSAVSGCCGCCKSRAFPSETKRIVGIVCAVFSWIAAVVACALLSVGASWNANVVRIGPAPFCPYLKDGILAGGGVLALAATALGLASFIVTQSHQPAAGAPPSNGGATGGPSVVAIGHPPQFLPAAPAAKPTAQPPTPEIALGQTQGAAVVSHAQGYVHEPQVAHEQFLPPQGYGSHAPNQQFARLPPPQVHPVNTAASGAQSFMPPQSVYPPQPQPAVQSYSPQHPAQPPAYLQVPAPPVAPSQVCQAAGGQTGVRKDGLVVAGANLLMRVAQQSLSSDDTANAAADPAATPGDVFLPSGGDSTTQVGVQDTNCA